MYTTLTNTIILHVFPDCPHNLSNVLILANDGREDGTAHPKHQSPPVGNTTLSTLVNQELMASIALDNLVFKQNAITFSYVNNIMGRGQSMSLRSEKTSLLSPREFLMKG